MTDQNYMLQAIQLAKQGEGWTNPNPMVGAVIVKNGRIIGKGYHKKCGELHAERNAIASLTESAEGATIYVTLEPCCHYGKTPPCTEAIIEQKIKRVVIGSRDPNPKVSGKGIKMLQEAGIEVIEDFMREECDRLNPVFFHYITTKTPYVVMKYAMTLDGKIACATGDSKWVTGEIARTQVHRMRGRYRGIMVGIGTVLADDPMLNCRVEGGVDPVRIICDSNLRIPTESQIVKTASDIETIVACSQEALESERKQEKIRRLKEAGIQIIGTEGAHGVNLVELMKKLGGQNIDSILLEGGGTLNASALEDGIVNKVYAYIAGKLIGGMDARSPVEGMGIDRMADAITLQNVEIEKLGDDFCIVGYVK